MQPAILINRFIINLRSLNKIEDPTYNSDANHLSRFSAPNFVVNSNILGNIGEPLEHGQAEKFAYEDDNEPANTTQLPAAEAQEEHNLTERSIEQDQVAGPSQTPWEDLELGGMNSVAGPSGLVGV